MAERDQFMNPLACSHCGAAGMVVWEENSHSTPDGPQRRLVSVHGAFHAEPGRTKSRDPVIVCDACDQIQPD